MATYAKLLKNSNGDNILPYTRDNYVYHGDSTTDTVYSQLNTINQNLMPTYAAQAEVYPMTTGATQSYTTPEKGWYAIFTSDTGTAVTAAISCYVGACLVSYWVYSDPYSGASTVLPIPANTVIRIEGRATSRMRIYKLS